jgi:glycosyltransferase involved in cell wall biosynthesis
MSKPVRGGIDRIVARQRLEMNAGARAFLWFGQMRPYKALDEYLPAMLQVLEREPSAWLTVAGKVRAPDTRKMLESAGEQARFINRHVPNIELQHLANAADFGILTYRHILTSGALFHMYCMGLPAIAPDLGAMAGYVIPGWNGFLYRSADELAEIMQRVCSMGDDEIEWFAANARETVTRFEWGRVV